MKVKKNDVPKIYSGQKKFMKMEERMKEEWRKNGKNEKMTFFDNFKNSIFSFRNEHVLLPG